VAVRDQPTAAAGLSDYEILQGAGLKKFGQLLLNGQFDLWNGIPFVLYPYGNQWDKQEWTQQKIRYFRNGCIHP
jgi:hypothetical protein